MAAVLLREGVMVWVRHFPWSGSCPLGERSLGEIQAWVQGGRAYMEECSRKDDLAKRIARREKRIARREKRLREQEAEAKAKSEEKEEEAEAQAVEGTV